MFSSKRSYTSPDLISHARTNCSRLHLVQLRKFDFAPGQLAVDRF